MVLPKIEIRYSFKRSFFFSARRSNRELLVGEFADGFFEKKSVVLLLGIEILYDN